MHVQIASSHVNLKNCVRDFHIFHADTLRRYVKYILYLQHEYLKASKILGRHKILTNNNLSA